ncbi:hypothetical protein [Campylobacter showae]|uniref:Uncharacterized protein n=1 Tax=Campylobacter showae CSUNSWCD TaxID=1244083 RepID=M5IQE9_9BACT|nr:hypothetical protein [Campylobacter showae]EKU11479.1 hypothetical protein CSUNSWCD_2105 [Campylobacter showae CSUNSWCD]
MKNFRDFLLWVLSNFILQKFTLIYKQKQNLFSGRSSKFSAIVR